MDDERNLKHEVLLEEYKQHRFELVHTMTHTRNVYYWYILSFCAIISATPFVVQSEIYIIYLIFPFVMIALFLVMLHLMTIHIEITRYLKNETIPQIRDLLSAGEELAPKANNMLTWYTGTGWRAALLRYPWWLKVAAAMSALIPVGVSALSIIAFFYFRTPKFSFAGVAAEEWTLIAIDTFITIYSFAIAYLVAMRRLSTN